MAGPANTHFSVAVHVLTYLAGREAAAHGCTPSSDAVRADDSTLRVEFVQPNELVQSDELAHSTGMTAVHIRRILAPLRAAGLITSRSGANGGSRLARAASSIYLDEVYECVNLAPMVASHMPTPDCPVGKAVSEQLSDIERDASAAMTQVLHRRTIADLASAIDIDAATA